jgi:hypothetical protein
MQGLRTDVALPDLVSTGSDLQARKAVPVQDTCLENPPGNSACMELYSVHSEDTQCSLSCPRKTEGSTALVTEFRNLDTC